jgi:multidrug resistance efflux pump
MFTRYLLPIAAVALLGFAVFYVRGAQKDEPPIPPPQQAPRSPYHATVAGTGVVEPQTENISVGTQMPGIVVEVFVKVNQQVNAGDPLFRLDDRELRAKLKLQQAALAQAQASLTRLKSLPREEDKPVARAKVLEAEANAADKLALFQRSESLRATNAVSEEERVTREHAYQMSRAQLDYAKAQLELLEAGSWSFDVDVAAQAVQAAQAQVDQVQTDIDRLIVRALVDGEVLQVNVRPGEYVGITPGQAYVVLGDVAKLHVRVSIDEHDIPRYRVGAKATAQLKGTPEIQYPLSFVRIEPFVVPKKSLTGENTERVDTRVLQVIYSVDSQKERLYVGQQLDVFINGDAAPRADAPPAS